MLISASPENPTEIAQSLENVVEVDQPTTNGAESQGEAGGEQGGESRAIL